MAFVQRLLGVTIGLANGTTIALPTTLRAAAVIEKYGAPGFNTAVLRIYGLPLDGPSGMSAITTNWVPLPVYQKNTVTVTAGDAGAQMSVVFQGGIRLAYAVLDGSPEPYFEIVAAAALLWTQETAGATSYPGPADTTQIMKNFASKMNLGFENAGVNGVVLSNPAFTGNLWDQVRAAGQAANITVYLDEVTQTLVIVPQGGSRQSGSVPVISAATGMVGYPRYTGSGIGFRTLFNPQIQFLGQVQVQSIIKPACGNWVVSKLTYDLESQVFGGNWFCDVGGYSANQAQFQ